MFFLVNLAQIFQPSYKGNRKTLQDKTERIWPWRQYWVKALQCCRCLNFLGRPKNKNNFFGQNFFFVPRSWKDEKTSFSKKDVVPLMWNIHASFITFLMMKQKMYIFNTHYHVYSQICKNEHLSWCWLSNIRNMGIV